MTVEKTKWRKKSFESSLHYGRVTLIPHLLGMCFSPLLIRLLVQSLSSVCLWPPWTQARQASLSSVSSLSLFTFMSIESVMLSNHLIPCYLLLVLPSVFSSWSALHIGSQSIGASASASVLPVSTQGWFPLGFTALVSLLPRGPQESQGCIGSFICFTVLLRNVFCVITFPSWETSKVR